MKILHFIEGSDVSFRVPWVDLMKELRRRGVDQALLCKPGALYRIATEDGVEARAWRSATPFFPPANLQYPFLLRRFAPDIVHTRLSNAAFCAGFWGRRLKIPTIAMLDGAYKIKYYRKADRYMACSRWVKDHFAEQGIDPSLIDVVGNSIETGKYSRGDASLEERKKFREARGFGSDEKVFLGAGSFVPAKGFEVLLRAFAALAREEPHARLLLVGDGPLRALYAGLIDSLGIAGLATLSDCFAEDIRPWMWGADFFVLPSREEPFGIVLIEAMASGLPVIVTDKGGPREVIEDGREGFIVQTDDAEAMSLAMKRLLRMEKTRMDRMLADSAQRLAYFSSEALADRQIAIYERVLEGYRARR